MCDIVGMKLTALPVPYFLRLHQGDQWVNFSAQWLESPGGLPVDLTDWSAVFSIAPFEGAPAAHVFTSADGDLEVSGSQGLVTLVVPASKTALVTPGDYYHTLKVRRNNDPDDVRTLLRGTLVVTGKVSA